MVAKSCIVCGSNLRQVPKVFAKEKFGFLFYCERESCTNYEKKIDLSKQEDKQAAQG